ncbi:MAG TPA: hypothetical protein PKA27_16940 [Fimbriimonadaceae bacterium]|nr:hypothetical protein [Fimbriimonadaceae bacterium]
MEHPHLQQIYERLKQSYPDRCPCSETRVDTEDPLVDALCDRLFPRSGSWSEVAFPEESSFVIEAFMLLSQCARAYYYAAYMWQALANPYYRSGSLRAIEDVQSRGSFAYQLWTESSLDQRSVILSYLDFLASQEVSKPLIRVLGIPLFDPVLTYEVNRSRRLLNLLSEQSKPKLI